MKIMIRGSKIEITDSMNNMIQKKLSKVDKFISNNDMECRVVVKQESKNYKIEITINVPNFVIRAEASDKDMYACIDLVVNKLEKQLKKTNAKLKKHKTNNEFNYDEFNDKLDEVDSSIEKRKKLNLNLMSEDEAILQLELIDHDFYVFKNSDTDSTCILYKKRNGQYGIIEID